jgi:hypothetical protein
MPAMPDPTMTVSQVLSPSSRPRIRRHFTSIQREQERLSKLSVIGLSRTSINEMAFRRLI